MPVVMSSQKTILTRAERTVLKLNTLVVKIKKSPIPKHLSWHGESFLLFVCFNVTIPSGSLPGRSRCTAVPVPGNTLPERGAKPEHLQNTFYHPFSRDSNLAYFCVATLENFGFAN